jgi:hypothetical protein
MKYILLICALIVLTSSIDIKFRTFSNSPSIGRPLVNGRPASLDPYDFNYGALQFFINYTIQETSKLGNGQTVNFVLENWNPLPNCSVLETVGHKPGCGPPRDAAYDSGAVLNPVWGFMFNSVMFGMNFDDQITWLYYNCSIDCPENSPMKFAQNALNAAGANVEAIAVLGSPQQSSGYFQKNMSEDGIEVACVSNWTWRYLPPPQNVVNNTCYYLHDEGVISSPKISFVTAVPGVSVLGGVQKGIITAFEFVAAVDNYNATSGGFFPVLDKAKFDCVKYTPESGQCAQNPGHKGLTYVSYPSWHQPIFTGFMIINQEIWRSLSVRQQMAIRKAAYKALYDSYDASNSVECYYTQQILDINNNQVQLNIDGTVKDCNLNQTGVQSCSADMKIAYWDNQSLDYLRIGTDIYYKQLLAGNITVDKIIFKKLLDSYNNFMDKYHAHWKPGKFPKNCKV